MRLKNRGQQAAKARALRLFQKAVAALKPGDLAIDCGANVGKFTLPMAQTGADVIAYEPDPEIFTHLTEALKDWPKAVLYAAAVSDRAGEIELIRSPFFAENKIEESVKSTILPEARTRDQKGNWREMDHKNTVAVPLINLIDMLAHEIATRGHIALLKIDIEGAELDILEAMLARDQFAKIGLTVVEMHGFRVPDTRARIERIQAAIRKRYPPKQVNFDWC